MSSNILVVDDEEVLQDVLGTLLKREGFRPVAARTGEEALLIAEREPIDLVLLDLMLPGMSGMEVLKQLRGRDPEQVVIVITAYSSIESAIEAMRVGAFHYIPKPFKNEEVLLTIRKGLEQRRLTSENRSLKQELEKRYGLDKIIGKSSPMQQVFDLIRLAAPSKSNMLILGESGTQGARRQGAASPQPAHLGPIRDRELGLDAARPARKYALRPRQRRFHRGDRGEERAVRSRQQRLDLLR